MRVQAGGVHVVAGTAHMAAGTIAGTVHRAAGTAHMVAGEGCLADAVLPHVLLLCRRRQARRDRGLVPG
jgi:hypothetical protein